MTSSEKPDRPDSQPQDGDRTSASTQTVADSAQAAPAGPGTSRSDSAESAAGSGSGQESAPADEPEGTAVPPPWQRGAATSVAVDAQQSAPQQPAAGSAGASGALFGGPDAEDTQTIPKPVHDQETVRTKLPDAGRTKVSFTGGAGAAGQASGTAARRPSRGPRRASLQIKRLDPWSVLKLALVLSVAMFFVWMIAVAVLYGVLDGMGVWEQLNGTFTDLTQPEDAASEPLISAGRVFGVAMIIGAINIVLITALSTVASFIYNVAADLAGGVEVTLSERE
ncbi:DUF3566 domain-containing protein [Saccharopolyspora cebuensis]|uniref:DUF3566 domain-containing protein n=1 Tax=Saccharopolyspora cebuensis TaxID=418759 RepID=A0ABV4CMD4_9PSEU